MAVQKGAKRYQHNITGEVRYFKTLPDVEMWSKIGTKGSSEWRWITNTIEERFIHKKDPIPSGFYPGRIRT